MELQRVYSKIFAWMFIGLLLTFLTGYTVSNNLNMLMFVFNGPTWIILAIVEVGLVIALTAVLHKMSPIVAKICFIIYSIVTGLTFATIFIVYELSSIIFVFGITALLFGLFAIIGHFTKLDLTKIGIFLLMGLIGIVICSIINAFVGSETFDLGIAILGIVIFLVYSAYDMQVIKRLIGSYPNEDSLAIYGALQLYLDFINLFLKLIRIFGKRND